MNNSYPPPYFVLAPLKEGQFFNVRTNIRTMSDFA